MYTTNLDSIFIIQLKQQSFVNEKHGKEDFAKY